MPDADDDSLDLVMEGADGLVMTLSWPEVVARRSWLVTAWADAHSPPRTATRRGC